MRCARRSPPRSRRPAGCAATFPTVRHCGYGRCPPGPRRVRPREVARDCLSYGGTCRVAGMDPAKRRRCGSRHASSPRGEQVDAPARTKRRLLYVDRAGGLADVRGASARRGRRPPSATTQTPTCGLAATPFLHALTRDVDTDDMQASAAAEAGARLRYP